LLEEIGPMFEKASGHKVTLGFGTSQQVAKRMDAGETADLVVITPEAIEQRQGAGDGEGVHCLHVIARSHRGDPR
jgi:ABC-type molybdate transport system substrate-binding protein